MPEFTLHRNYTLRTTKGHCISFIKDEPTWVPPMASNEAVAIGAVPVIDTDRKNVIGDEEKTVIPLTPDQRKAKVKEAFAEMANRSERSDFTASGTPNRKKLQAITGFDVVNREVDLLWKEFKLEQRGEEVE